MASCPYCGGNEFVRANLVRSGWRGRGQLSLRSGGGLPLATRVCLGCGRAELFLRDTSVLRDPSKWEDGEFARETETPAPPPPTATPSSEPPPPPPPVSAPVPPPTSAPVPAEEPSAASLKRAPRRRNPPKSKAPAPPLILE